MANEEHVAIVRQGPKAINDWRINNSNVRLDLRGANFSREILGNVDLTGAILIKTNLNKAILIAADLSSCKCDFASLSDASLLDVTVNQETQFNNLRSTRKCKIDRVTLASLRDYGGLTIGNRIKMDIVNDVAKLRQSFSGYLFWVHVACVMAFLYPYAAFLVKLWYQASFTEPVRESIAVGCAFLYFILSGGESWTSFSPQYLPLTSFVVFMFYNVLRAVLLWKTKQLETVEKTTELPADFYLATSPLWNRTYSAVRIIQPIAVLSVIEHTFHFMTMRVLLPAGS